MCRFTGFSEKSFFFKENLKFGQRMGCDDAIALNFMKKLDSTDCSMWLLERLDFQSDMM